MGSLSYVVNPRLGITTFIRFLRSVAEEYAYEKVLPFQTPFTFLDRMKKASHIKPLKRLACSGHLSHTQEMYKKDLKTELEAKEKSLSFFKRAWKKSPLKALFTDPPHMSKEHHAEHIANQRLEEQRVIANVLALAFVTLHLSKFCTQAVDFYLDDRYTRERQALVALCKNENSSSQEIMGYIWEAYRIGQRFGLWRIAAGNERIRIIEQGLVGYPNVTIEPGDRVFADFTFAHNDPKHVPEPQKVDPHREINSLLGLGLHKCPARSLIDETMSQIIRVIFSQKDLKRADGQKGRLKSATLHPDDPPWCFEKYLDEHGGFSHYPKHMEIEFDASNSEEFEDSPGHISILRHVVFVNNFICLCSSSIWISLLIHDILLRGLRCLIFVLSFLFLIFIPDVVEDSIAVYLLQNSTLGDMLQEFVFWRNMNDTTARG
ncbi:hypothetical protein F5887DRAFT_245338 [Amanita rubescens]|nr:hypothetical protein F5887DRAFT_245338 [Amanita rubescens]